MLAGRAQFKKCELAIWAESTCPELSVPFFSLNCLWRLYIFSVFQKGGMHCDLRATKTKNAFFSIQMSAKINYFQLHFCFSHHYFDNRSFYRKMYLFRFYSLDIEDANSLCFRFLKLILNQKKPKIQSSAHFGSALRSLRGHDSRRGPTLNCSVPALHHIPKRSILLCMK